MQYFQAFQCPCARLDEIIRASALGTAPAALMDDSLMKQTELLLSRMGVGTKNTVVADTRPRYFAKLDESQVVPPERVELSLSE